MPEIKNIPSRAGELATKKRFSLDNSRFAIAAIHTRFDKVCWFVWDSHNVDKIGLPSVVRQEWSEADARKGLDFAP